MKSLEIFSKEDVEIMKKSRVLHAIKNGEVQVKWNSWFFAGGRDWGSSTNYTLFCDGKECGRIEDSEVDGLTVTIGSFEWHEPMSDSEYGAPADKEFGETIRDEIEKAFIRDDKEFVDKISCNGEIYYPCDFEDISRDDVLSGRWEPDVSNIQNESESGVENQDAENVISASPKTKSEMVHYKGKFGEFDFDKYSDCFELDEWVVSERYHEHWQGDPDEDYFDDVYFMVLEDPSKYDEYIESWSFKNGPPVGYKDLSKRKISQAEKDIMYKVTLQIGINRFQFQDDMKGLGE